MTDQNSGIAEAAAARADLYDTLTQLTDRLNYAQRVDNALARAKANVTRVRSERPWAFAAAAAGAAAAVGVAVWGVAATIARKVS